MNCPYWLVATGLPLAVVFLFLSSRCTSAQSFSSDSANAAPPSPSAEEVGGILMVRGRYVAALQAYRRAPVNAVTLNKMGVVWHHLRALDRAKRCYEQALALRPDYPEAISNLASIAFAEEDYREALRLYQRAFSLDPHNAQFAANLGAAYFALDMPKAGREAWRTAYALDPEVFDSDGPGIVQLPAPQGVRAAQDYSLATLRASHHNYREALNDLRRAIDEGFRDWARLRADGSFADLQQDPEYGADFAGLAAGP